jgi:hypothetical protein
MKKNLLPPISDNKPKENNSNFNDLDDLDDFLDGIGPKAKVQGPPQKKIVEKSDQWGGGSTQSNQIGTQPPK